MVLFSQALRDLWGFRGSPLRSIAVRSYRPLPILPGSKDGGWGGLDGLGREGWEMKAPLADSKLSWELGAGTPWCQALRKPGAGKMKVFTVWGNRNRSTPGTYRQLLAQTLKKAKDVHCTWQPQLWCTSEVMSFLSWLGRNLQGPTLCQMRTIPLTARAAWS